MHIADFSFGHLGANAIVGGSVPIATGAALASRYLRNGAVVCCFAGDGAFANGVARRRKRRLRSESRLVLRAWQERVASTWDVFPERAQTDVYSRGT
jgi:hypothetical protein